MHIRVSSAGGSRHTGKPLTAHIPKMAKMPSTRWRTSSCRSVATPSTCQVGNRALCLEARPLSVGTVHGGTAVNVVPDSCVIELDRRLLPDETPEAARKELLN